MKKAKAYWLRFWHCLFKFHRAEQEKVTVTYLEQSFKITTYIGCECGKCWYGERPEYMKTHIVKL